MNCIICTIDIASLSLPEIVTLNSYVYTISYTYIVYDIVFYFDDIVHDILHDGLPDI